MVRTGDKVEMRHHRAARGGQPAAMFSLAALLAAKGDYAPALHWYHRADEAGHPGAADRLAEMFKLVEGFGDDGQWFRRAVAGDPHFMQRVAALLFDPERPDASEYWVQRSRAALT